MFLGIDIGTSSSKGVLVSDTGELLATAVEAHQVSRPAPGQFESDPELWWREFCTMSARLVAAAPGPVTAVGVSGMGPCVAVADANFTPLRPAILYGVDSRATAEISALTQKLGADEVLQRCGSALSTQAVGPKLHWLATHEPEIFSQARKLLGPNSWLAYRLTGAYICDHQTASQSVPLYDSEQRDWFSPWWDEICPQLDRPKLCWANDVIGTVTSQAAKATGLPAGVPVVAGTIDAWSEAISADAHGPGDLMLMYGTTLFMVNTVTQRRTHPVLWSTVGALRDTRNLAAGLSTSGALTQWLQELFGGKAFPDLIAAAAESQPGADGLLMLPYFAGERTPIADPDARGTIVGLTLDHNQGDLYRAALEAVGFGIRHNVEAMQAAGGQVHRVVAVGGGTQGSLWTQIVSDITGLTQILPTHTIGASLGAAYLAASSQGPAPIPQWNPPLREVVPNPQVKELYDQRYELYRELYTATASINHALARSR